MKKIILPVILFINLVFIVGYLIDTGFPFGSLWLVWLPFFVAGIILSIMFLVRYKKESNANLFLSLAVLLSSLSSLGLWSFYYYLARVMGG
ncbi:MULTISPECIES: hypothetical protein [Geobacillus]|uniref:hypothetical protein n=1 Tax=Geobacillus TaxID=129337 RepID=UPI0009BEFEA2|nr:MULTISPECIES: hypothetical protein [Geobacillus]OQP15330.1 hypothetical protein B1693_14065 [Geobacillus zalihae]RXS87998.1 hypothetical protein ETR37_09660 [Geobacillus sp. PK12]